MWADESSILARYITEIMLDRLLRAELSNGPFQVRSGSIAKQKKKKKEKRRRRKKEEEEEEEEGKKRRRRGGRRRR